MVAVGEYAKEIKTTPNKNINSIGFIGIGLQRNLQLYANANTHI